jgi:6-phosphogluconolactonase
VVAHQLQRLPNPEAVAAAAAEYVAAAARRAVAQHGHFRFAVSGGRTPWAMFARLATEDLPWEQVVLYQVDERVAPDGDPDRNLTQLEKALGGAPATLVAMPVTQPDLWAAAADYAALLPGRLDLAHLGLGPDGHTASLVPGDPVLEIDDRLVGVTAPYQGHVRMTLTYPALGRADQLLWLVTGSDKQWALDRLLAGDRSIPAGRVEAEASLILADAAAAGDG